MAPARVQLTSSGEPGGSGTEFTGRFGQNISTVLNSFNILGFDPRGFLNASDEGLLGLYGARTQVVADRGPQTDGGEEGIARFMSTASVVTDMLKITEKLGRKKLHYWGFASISPPCTQTKSGRMVLDGVYDAQRDHSALWDSNLLDNEAVINSLFTALRGLSNAVPMFGAERRGRVQGGGSMFALWAAGSYMYLGIT
ncbi:hypothetical protein LXA43DRAFT_1089996 [Ganoderma leucocontextum]|nr:hypothetical protein LXA43DRAFT_1089996 [Ganoderma leucocontextum]